MTIINTATLQMLAQFTYGNVQKSTVKPPPLPVLTDSTPTGHFDAVMMLPAGGGYEPLPVPATWSRVTQLYVVNMDPVNHCLLQKVNPSAMLGGTVTTPGTFSTAPLAGVTGHLGAITSLAVGDYFTIGDVAFQCVPQSPPITQQNQYAPGTNPGDSVYNLMSVINSGSSWSQTPFEFQASLVGINETTDMVITSLANGPCLKPIQFTMQGGKFVMDFPTSVEMQHLVPNGGLFAGSFGAMTVPAYTVTVDTSVTKIIGQPTASPPIWQLASCDANGVLANGQMTEVYVYMTGY